MAAFEAGNVDLQLGPALRAGAGRQVEDQIGRATAGAAYEQRPVFLGVQVEHCPAREQASLEVRGPRQSGLLVHGEEQLEGAVGDGRVVGGGLRGRHADTVVRAERGLGRDDPIAIDDDLDRVLQKVEVGGFVLLGDHVHVALQDDGGGLLSALGAGHVDDEVADRVAAVRQAARLGPGAQVRHHGLLVAGRSRDAPQGVKMPPQQRRLKRRNRTGHVHSFKVALVGWALPRLRQFWTG